MERKSHPTFGETLGAFWSGKRFLILVIFALIFANVVFYTMHRTILSQIFSRHAQRHESIYQQFLQNVEQAKRIKTQSASTGKIISPYLIARDETKKYFPEMKLELLSPENSEKNDMEAESKIDAESFHLSFRNLKNKSAGYGMSEESSGWIRSMFKLPTKDFKVLFIRTNVSKEIDAWKSKIFYLGSFGFIVMLLFGWFWSRMYHYASRGVQRASVLQKIEGVQNVVEEIGLVVGEIATLIAELEKNSTVINPETKKTIDDIISQVHLLAVNGSVEAARNHEAFRVFHVIMSEVGRLTEHCQLLLEQTKGSDIAVSELKRRVENIDNIMKRTFSSDEPLVRIAS